MIDGNPELAWKMAAGILVSLVIFSFWLVPAMLPDNAPVLWVFGVLAVVNVTMLIFFYRRSP